MWAQHYQAPQVHCAVLESVKTQCQHKRHVTETYTWCGATSVLSLKDGRRPVRRKREP
jgi:L-fucose isomerase-like protein